MLGHKYALISTISYIIDLYTVSYYKHKHYTKCYHLRMKLVPRKVIMHMMPIIANNRLTTNVALSSSQAYSSSAIGVTKLLQSTEQDEIKVCI